jgi:parallel beta-helix repeat protein
MRFPTIVLCIIITLFSVLQVRANIIRVPDDSSTIQGGINGTVNGDTVLVAPGIYYEHINFKGKNIQLRSEAGAESTTINKLHDGIAIVTFESGEDSGSILDGFTIENSVSKPGIVCDASSPIISNNIISNNSIGIHIYKAAGIIRDNIIRDNNGKNGGIFLQRAFNSRVERNLLISNYAYDGGGGIAVSEGSDNFVLNNTLIGNSSSKGGGVIVWYTDYCTLINNIIVGGGTGYGIYHFESHSSVIEYNDVWNNQPDNYYGCSSGECNISADPLFCDPENNNYLLRSASPCLNAEQFGVDMGAFGSCACADISPGPNQSGPANTKVSVVFHIINATDSAYKFDLSISDSQGWNVIPASAEMKLKPGQTDSISLTVSIPDVVTGTVDRIMIETVAPPTSIFASFASLLVTASPRTIPVPDEQPTIQAGIDSSGPGDTILIAPGIYYEHINFHGKPVIVKSKNGANSTILSMLAGGVSMVSFVSGEDSNAVLDGFTITGAFLEVGQGAGIKCQDSSPKIVNNRIVNNSCTYGAGIDCDNHSSPIITKNVIEQNPATSRGGGIRCRNHSSPIIRRNLIIDNSAVESGAGIWCEEGCSPTIVGNLIARNMAGTGYGGGIGLMNSSAADVTDNTIDFNSAVTGGGVYIDSTSSATIVNTIVTNTTSGKGIRFDGAYPLFIYHCNVWNNLNQNYYGCLPGDGCISADPKYCNPQNSDYTLGATSPCLGAGKDGDDTGAFNEGCSSVGNVGSD